MGIFANDSTKPAPSILAGIKDIAGGNAAGETTAKAEKPKSEFWLNVGVEVPGEDGEPVFVSLPVGIALDDMKPQVVKGNNTQFNHLIQAKNLLLNQLQVGASSLEPGAEVPMNLVVKLRRVGKPDQVGNSEDNPLMAGLAKLFGTAKTGTNS